MQSLSRVLLALVILLAFGFLLRTCARWALRLISSRFNLKVDSVAWFAAGKGVLCLSEVQVGTPLTNDGSPNDPFHLRFDAVTTYLRRPEPGSKHKWVTLQIDGMQVYVHPPKPKKSESPSFKAECTTADSDSSAATSQTPSTTQRTDGSMRQEAATDQAAETRVPSSGVREDGPTASEPTKQPHTDTTNLDPWMQKCQRLFRRLLLRCLEAAMFLVVSFVDVNVADSAVHAGIASIFLGRLTVHLKYADTARRDAVEGDTSVPPPPRSLSVPDVRPSLHEKTKPTKRPSRLALEIGLEEMTVRAPLPVDRNTGVQQTDDFAESSHDGDGYPLTAFELCGAAVLTLSCRADYGYRKLNDFSFDLVVDPISLYLHNLLEVGRRLVEMSPPRRLQNPVTEPENSSHRPHRRSISTNSYLTSSDGLTRETPSAGVQVDLRTLPRTTNIDIKSVTLHYTPVVKDVSATQRDGDSVPHNNDCAAAAIAAADISVKLYLQPTSQKNQCLNCLPDALQNATFRISRVVGDFYGQEPSNWSMHALEVGTIYLHVEGGHQLTGSLEVNTPSIRIDINFVQPISAFLKELNRTIQTVQPSKPNPKNTEEGYLKESQSQLLPRKAPTRRKIGSGRRESLIPMKELSGGLLCRLSPALLLMLETSPPIIFHMKVVEFVLSIRSDQGEPSAAFAVTSGCHELLLGAQYGEVVPTSDIENQTETASKNQTDYFGSSTNASTINEANGDEENLKRGAWGLLRATLRSDTLYIGMHRGKTTKTRPIKSTNLFTNDILKMNITAQLIRKRTSPLLPSPLDRPDSTLDDDFNFPEDPAYSDLIMKLQLGNLDIWLFEEQTKLLNTILGGVMQTMPEKTNTDKSALLRSNDLQRSMEFLNANLLFEARRVQLHCAGPVSPEDLEPRGLLLGFRCIRVTHQPFISANRTPGPRPVNGDIWSDRSQLEIRFDDIDVSVLVQNRNLPTGGDSFSAGANLINIPSVDVTLTIAASVDVEIVSEVTITVKIPEIDVHFSALHLYSAFACLILVRSLLEFRRQSQQTIPAKWHVRGANDAHRRFSIMVPESLPQKPSLPPQLHSAIQVWVTVDRFDVVWNLPDGPTVFWELDKFLCRGTLPEGNFGGSVKAFRVLGIKPDSTTTKSELVRLNDVSVLLERNDDRTDVPEVNETSRDLPELEDGEEVKESEQKQSNKELSVMIQMIELRIPYKYVVSEVFESTNNLVKFGKRLAAEFIPATGESPTLPKARVPLPTVVVAIDAIHCRIDDDPFEIAIARTYTAGFEEQKARLAREQAFHHKLSTINQAGSKMGHGGGVNQSTAHQGAGYDVESAWQNLQEYNSRNWIRRIKEYTALQSSQNAPHNIGDPPTDTASRIQAEARHGRSNSTISFHSSESLTSSTSLQSVAPSIRPIPLFRLSASHLRITLRDPGFGRAEAPRRISQLDGGQSSVTQKYDLLFCCDVELGLSEAIVRIRNHPLPLAHVPPSRQQTSSSAASPASGSAPSVVAQPESSFVLKGLFILAEPLPAPESIFRPFVPIASISSEQVDPTNQSEKGFGLLVERTVAPVKIFYDMDVKILSELPALVAFGVDILPSVQDISRVMDTLTKPNLDPSPALGFWDKIRLLVHGRIGIEFVGPPAREVTDADCAEKRREETTTGGFRLLLSGSRDPFYMKNKSAGTAGYEAVWSGGTKMEVGGTNTDFVSIVADQFIFGIPKGEPTQANDVSQEPSLGTPAGGTDGPAKPQRPVAGPGFEKVVVKFSGGIRLALGARFENESTGTQSRAICPHSQVVMRSPENVQTGSKYDSFKSFRSAAIHGMVTLTCPTSQSAAASPYNIIHITPNMLIHSEKWISLFAGNMTLPVRCGPIFPGSLSVPNKKLDRFLRTIRARANISPLFVTYMHSGKESVVGGADVGLKGRLERFLFDLVCEKTIESESSASPPTWTVSECQLDVTKIDIRAISYVETGSASIHHPVGESDSQSDLNGGFKQGSTIGEEESEWADADDYTEIGKTSDDEDRIARGILCGTPIIEPFIFSPRLVYFIQPKHPLEGSEDLDVGDEEDDGSSKNIREGRDTHKVQSDLLQLRLQEIERDVERQAIKLKEMESKITQVSSDEAMLQEVCAHTKEHVDRMSTLHYKRNVISHYLQNIHKSGQAGQDLLTQGAIPDIQLNVYDDREPQVATPLLLDSAVAASFAHRYIVHNALILWNVKVRNIMFKFFDMEQQHSALRYLMSQTAATFVRNMSERRADGNDNGSPDENWEGNHMFDHLAAEELLSKLINEQDQSFIVQNELFSNEEDIPAESLGQSMASTHGHLKRTKDPRHPEYIPDGYVPQNDHLVQLINPQLNFHSIGNDQGCMIIAAERAQLKSLSILDQNYRKHKNNELVKVRHIFTVDNAQFFLAFKSHFVDPPPGKPDVNYGATNGDEEWPVWIPIECLVDHGDDLGPFQRVVDRSTFTVHYDKHNPVRLVRKKTNRASFSTSNRDMMDEKADSLNIRFPRIRFCATSLQYAMIFDVVTDLLVYNDPSRRERAKHVKGLALAADLDNLRGAAEGIVMLQERIRNLSEVQKQYRDNLTQLKRSEHANQMLAQYAMVNKELLEAKEQLYVMMEAFSAVQQVKENKERAQLAVRTQIQADQVSWEMLLDSRSPFAEWELKNANFVLLNNEDHSNMKWLEVDQLRLTNRLPHPYFLELVGPFVSDSQKLGLLDFSRHKMLRVYWGEMAPVGGIAVVDHFEVNIFPLVFQMTYDIGKHLITYYFPENRKKESGGSGHSRDGSSTSTGTGQTAESPILDGASDLGSISRLSGSNSRLSMKATVEDDASSVTTETSNATSSGSVLAASAMAMSAAARAGEIQPANATSLQKQSRSYSVRLATSSTDLVQMATRASKNKTFIYIKVPGVPHCVSYQGEKETNFVDLTGFLFKSPTLEYRNKTWTWLEFMMQLKKDIIRAVLGHTGSLVNQKLQQLRTRSANVSSTNSIQIPSGGATATSPSPLSAPVHTLQAKHVSADSSRASSASSSPTTRRKHGRGFSGSTLPSSMKALGSDDQLSANLSVASSEAGDAESDLAGGGKRKDKKKLFGGIKSKMKEIIGHTDLDTFKQSSPGPNSSGDAESIITDNNTESADTASEPAGKRTSESTSKGRLLFGKLYDNAGS